MKKIPLLFTLLMVVALVLSACATPEEEPDGILVTTEPGVDLTDVFEDDDLDADATDIVEDDDLGAEATATPLAEETPVGGAGGAGLPDTGQAADHSLEMSGLLGAAILNLDGDQIGTIDNMILEFCRNPGAAGGQNQDNQENTMNQGQGRARVSYIVAGFGGFLGIGDNSVLIPFRGLQFTDLTEENADVAVVLPTLVEDLENAPAFDEANVDFGDPNWDSEYISYWTNTVGLDLDVDTEGFEDGDLEGEVEVQTDVQDVDILGRQCFAMANDFLDLNVEMGAEETGAAGEGLAEGEDFTGFTVYDQNDTALGTVEDEITVNNRNYLVLDRGGEFVPVPRSAFNQEDDRLIFQGNEQLFAESRGFTSVDEITADTQVFETAVADYWTQAGVMDETAEDVDETDTGAAEEVDPTEVIGGIEDVVVDLSSGRIEYLVLSVDAFELGGDWVLVPPQALHLLDTEPDDDDSDAEVVVLNISEEDLANAPSFSPDTLPDLSGEDWDTDIRNYWTEDVGVEIDEAETEQTP